MGADLGLSLEHLALLLTAVREDRQGGQCQHALADESWAPGGDGLRRPGGAAETDRMCRSW